MRTRFLSAFFTTALAASSGFIPPVHAQWQLQTSNTTADLRGIHNVGNGVAWASGTNGTVLRTEDGGYVWQTCAIPPSAEKLDFRGIQAFDANTAIVMSSGKGDLSRLYKTTDGCHTWKLVFTNPDKDGFFDTIQSSFTTKYSWSWVLGDPVNGQFTLLEISDGGRRSTRQENPGLKASPDKQGAFAASNSSMFRLANGNLIFATGGTAGAKVYRETFRHFCIDVCLFCRYGCRSDPHGRRNKWEILTIPIGAQSEDSGVFSITGRLADSNLGQQTVIAVGGDYTKPEESTATAGFSADGGEHWTASQTPPHGYRSSVAYDDKLKTWVTVGPNGTDISTDDGKNWRAVHPSAALHEAPDADRNWNAISLPYVVGPKGRIGKLDESALK